MMNKYNTKRALLLPWNQLHVMELGQKSPYTIT